MQGHVIVRESPIIRTARVAQLQGMFDLPIEKVSRQEWKVDLTLPEKWNVGVVVGPSGAGKTTLIKELWPGNIVSDWKWSEDKTVVDDFPKEMGIREICLLLSSVGFSSPPSWMRPFHVLSNGEKFRCNMARALAEMKDFSVIDEYTSVVDRTVAKIGSSAFSKTVRKRNSRLILSTCHYDVIEWLEPDWVYEPHLNRLQVQTDRRELWRRPEIILTIQRVHSSAWELFRKHHYLNTELNRSAKCFVAFWEGEPVGFASALNMMPHWAREGTVKRGHRTVCLPDFQGVGIGNAVEEFVGAVCRGNGWRYWSIFSHPTMIAIRSKSENWKCIQAPNISSMKIPSRKEKKEGQKFHRRYSGNISTRLRATFEYIGPEIEKQKAVNLWYN